jgi:UPF0042 nucleotide-binding protein
MQTQNKPLLIIITGHSGAGLSTAVRALQDVGLYCIDNLPFDFILPSFKLIMSQTEVKWRGIAFGIHIHQSGMVDSFKKLKAQLQQEAHLDTVFLAASSEQIANRYSATRRPHPCFQGHDRTLLEAIQAEKDLLKPIESQADIVIDTSNLAPHQLVRQIESRYQGSIPTRSLHVSLTSFGFKHGQYRPSDAIFDVRFLENPHFIPKLRPQTGKDPEVQAFIEKDPRTNELLARLLDWHLWLLPHYYNEGKHYYRVGIGCTGGQHRSVYVTEAIASALRASKLPNISIEVYHRDLPWGGEI